MTAMGATGLGSSTPLVLSGDWRIGRLEPHRVCLLKALDSASTGFDLDASGITHIDTLGLQLLAVFVQQCLRRQITIHWSARPPLLQESGARLGLDTLLAWPADASAGTI